MNSDIELQKAVQAELSWEPSVIASHIGVTANAGVVTLTGHVENYASKSAAEAATRRVRGVKAVAEEIEVRLPFDAERDDGGIAAAALNRLVWDVSVPSDAIQVKVEKGWVTLTGQVEWHYQHDAAEQAVRRLYGVIGVSNHISIKPAVDVKNLSDEITHALHRSWFFNPQTITVTADAGKVRLTGAAHSMHDRQIAGLTAWSARGVTSVENDIIVN
jgi:osmotically-inducible protein OsmY